MITVAIPPILNRVVIMAAVVSVIVAGRVSADTVERHGSEPALSGRVQKIDDSGVTISSESGAIHFVPWDRIRDVSTEPNDPELAKYREDAAMLWRARTRLERNDAALAEPLFSRLFEKYRGKTHETALVVAEGLLRCRLARGADNESAVVPALETMRLRRAKVASESYRQLPPVLDETTVLCTTLPPAWVSALETAKLERELAGYDAKGDPLVASIAGLYRQAARQQLNMDATAAERSAVVENPGVKLLQSLVDMTCADAERREAARNASSREAASQPAWSQAWSYYFRGLSLLKESGVGRQQIGLVNMAYLPARFADSQPYLAGLALGRLAEMCDASGDGAAASMLRNELASRYPGHPLASSSVRGSPASRPAGTVTKSPIKEPL